ncbi:MAG: tetratricopeptide repeat protein [Chitinophagales bacterium]|nr:tetratricopeptide repeat protein [Chitinophagales bacterium]
MKIRSLYILIAIFSSTLLFAGGSPKTDNEIYNEGVHLMMELKFSKAEKKFQKALKGSPDFAEAHNNLAYCLRKQGEKYYEEAMQHYNKAIELKPDAAEPYMYRGVLFVSMGNKEAALRDHATLIDLGADKLATELEWVITNSKEKEPEQFFGVFQKVDA